jgi:hypothetical protein
LSVPISCRLSGGTSDEEQVDDNPVLCVLAILPVMAQQKSAPKSYVLKAARMFDGKSNVVLTPGLVVVSNGKIVGVGASAAVPATRS